MATRFINIDRSTPYLLPPDLRDWVPDDDMVHFVIEAVEGMPLNTFKVNRRGTGSRQYPPKMMLSLLIYCYANGIFSSRRIERATYRDVAVRYLTADTHPDHDTICKFRRENLQVISEVFLQVLQIARELGVLKVGTVSIDGTHIRANASKDKSVRYDRAAELDKQLEQDISELLKQAEQYDQEDDNDGQSLPKKIARREKLREKMQQARKLLERQAKDKAAIRDERKRLKYEKKLHEYEQESQSLSHSRKPRKPHKPKPSKQTPEAKDQANLTDGDSKIMRKNLRSSYEQSYNSQATVDADGSQLILANHVTNCGNDANELIAGVKNVSNEIGEIQAVLADNGYVNIDAIKTLAEDKIDMYVSVGREAKHWQRKYDYRPSSVTDKPGKTIKDECLLAMREKLQTDEGRALYAKRKHTVEPVFGIIKHVMGFRQFMLRGLEKVNGEWDLVCLAYNFKRLWNLKKA